MKQFVTEKANVDMTWQLYNKTK